MYSHRNEFPQEFGFLREMIPQKYFPVFARKRIQAPHVFAEKLIPRECFPVCIGFVPGGTSLSACISHVAFRPICCIPFWLSGAEMKKM